MGAPQIKTRDVLVTQPVDNSLRVRGELTVFLQGHMGRAGSSIQ